MSDFSSFDRRPIIVAIAGPNGAGKSTFYAAHLQQVDLRFVNADELSLALGLDAYQAAAVAAALREQLLRSGESFIFETVFSDPSGDKVNFLARAAAAGYEVVLCYIGLQGPAASEERVSMRVSQGGHDVPNDRLQSRFPRTLANLQRAIRSLPNVLVYDNSDLRRPYRQVAFYRNGQAIYLAADTPDWLQETNGAE